MLHTPRSTGLQSPRHSLLTTSCPQHHARYTTAHARAPRCARGQPYTRRPRARRATLAPCQPTTYASLNDSVSLRHPLARCLIWSWYETRRNDQCFGAARIQSSNWVAPKQACVTRRPVRLCSWTMLGELLRGPCRHRAPPLQYVVARFMLQPCVVARTLLHRDETPPPFRCS